MKTKILSLIVVLFSTTSCFATTTIGTSDQYYADSGSYYTSSGYSIQENAWDLTDRMAYELNLSNSQIDAVYQINFNFFYDIDNIMYYVVRGTNSYIRKYNKFLSMRDEDLSYVLSYSQYRSYQGLNYFYEPVGWERYSYNNSYNYRWMLSIALVFTNYRSHYYYSRPTCYTTYRGAYRRSNRNTSYYSAYTYHNDRRATPVNRVNRNDYNYKGTSKNYTDNGYRYNSSNSGNYRGQSSTSSNSSSSSGSYRGESGQTHSSSRPSSSTSSSNNTNGSYQGRGDSNKGSSSSGNRGEGSNSSNRGSSTSSSNSNSSTNSGTSSGSSSTSSGNRESNNNRGSSSSSSSSSSSRGNREGGSYNRGSSSSSSSGSSSSTSNSNRNSNRNSSSSSSSNSSTSSSKRNSSSSSSDSSRSSSSSSSASSSTRSNSSSSRGR